MNLSGILHTMRPGVARRKAIISYLKEHEDSVIHINRHWCIILKYDNDLKYMIKKNILKQCRKKTMRTSGHSYLTLVETK